VLGLDQAEADALISELADILTEDRYAYYHQWGADDVIIWDNWRVIHCVTGVPEGVSRLGIRTTISGDYNVGRYLDPTLDKDNPPERFDD
jgi:taurine dioxygenase